MAVERPDEANNTTLEQNKLIILGHLLRVAHTTVAEDTALTVDGNQRRELERLLEMALKLDEAQRAQTPTVNDVLQQALTALIAHQTVEQMIDQQKLDHSTLNLVDTVDLNINNHTILNQHRTTGLQLQNALNLDQAHAA